MMGALESLSETLQPYKDNVGLVASVVTIGQFFTGGFICKDIYKQKSTKGIAAIPFIGGLVIGVLMLKYALLLNDPAMLQVNLAAIILNVIYLLFYCCYSQDLGKEVFKPLSIGVALVAVFMGYANVESEENLEFRFGLAVTVLMLLLIGSPLLDVARYIQEKDASSIPFPMTLMGAIVSFLWFVYGIILLNYFMIVQNLIGFALCMVQLILIFLYPGSPEKKSDNPKCKSTKKKSQKSKRD